jgi:PAS domain S-box-containing protein
MEVNFTKPQGLALTPDFYSSIVRHASELITVVNWEGNYQYISDSAETVLGYSHDDLLGSNILELVHPDDLEQVKEEMLQLSLGGEKQVAFSPFRYMAKNGNWHWLSCVATNMLDNPHVQGVVTNSRDITSSMEALRQKRESQAYYKALYFANPDLVFTLSPEGQVVACNNAVVELSGYTREEFPESNFTEFVMPECWQSAFDAFQKALDGQSCTFETCITHRNGNIRHLTATLVPVLLDGRVQAVQCIAKDSTSEKQAHMLVQAQAKKVQNILESMNEGFFALDSNWVYTAGNSVFARFLNRTLEDLLYRCIWEEYPWLLHTRFHAQCLWVAANRLPSSFPVYLPVLDKTLHFSLNPFEDGILVSFMDISEQVAAQEELRKLSLVASKTTNGVIITNADGEIEWVNEAFSQVTGFTLDEIAGKRPSKFLTTPDIDPREVDWIREQLGQGIPMRKELRGTKKSGELIWADITISPIRDEQGHIEKHVYIHTDITERKLDQEQLLKATEHLYLQNQDLQQFNYIVSHNLRAPVANLMGLSAILQKIDPGSARFVQGLHNLDKSARRLDDVISDLNKILALRADNKNEAREQVYLPQVAAEVVQSLQHLFDQHNVQVRLSLSEEDVLWANRAYVYSILHNLISNAIKYKSLQRDLLIEVISVNQKNGLRLQVRDNGSGMDLEKVRPKLFQLYKRFHSGQEGKGIGLYLVKMQVQAIGGSIDVESAPEAGATFTIDFDSTAYGPQSIHNR